MFYINAINYPNPNPNADLVNPCLVKQATGSRESSCMTGKVFIYALSSKYLEHAISGKWNNLHISPCKVGCILNNVIICFCNLQLTCYEFHQNTGQNTRKN